MSSAQLTLTVDLPRDALAPGHTDPEALAVELRLLWIIDQVRRGDMSLAYGAALAGQDRWTFTRTLDEHGVPAIGYDLDDLERELALIETL